MASSQWHVEQRKSVENESPPRRDQEHAPETGSLSIVVLGASGDLAKKKTFPALFHLYRQGFLSPDEVCIFGYARTKITDDELRNRLQGYLVQGKDSFPEQLKDISM